ncbi:MAG: hypothetical protein MRY32_03535 [Rickettsiales bacterium]|nr:hypothetical protein [Rickettsiales bacterium]
MSDAHMEEKQAVNHVNQAFRRDIISLETKITRAIRGLDSACDAVRGLEKDIEGFLGEYYQQVGGYFEQLEAIERELKEYEADEPMPIAKRLFKEQEVLPKGQSKAIERDVKSLYRDMAKQFHPDNLAGGAAVESMKEDVIRTLNDAYSRKSLVDLWKIKLEVEAKQQDDAELPMAERVDVLQQRLDHLERAKQEVDKRRKKLEESQAYALFQRAFQLRLCGCDFIEQVVIDVRNQIDLKKKLLVSRKVRHLYMEAQTIRHGNASA